MIMSVDMMGARSSREGSAEAGGGRKEEKRVLASSRLPPFGYAGDKQ